jgi:hypothetical protein
MPVSSLGPLSVPSPWLHSISRLSIRCGSRLTNLMRGCCFGFAQSFFLYGPDLCELCHFSICIVLEQEQRGMMKVHAPGLLVYDKRFRSRVRGLGPEFRGSGPEYN